jgi:7,8-dihydroneopterin aldolase/epimerase/oxygenase
MNEIFRIENRLGLASVPVRILSTSVCVRAVRVEAFIGVYDHEQNRRQPLIIDVNLQVLSPISDNLAQTFNYERVAEMSQSLCDEHVDLIETFAFRLASKCLQNRSVLSAEVCVTKPEALSNGIPSVTIALVPAAA